LQQNTREFWGNLDAWFRDADESSAGGSAAPCHRRCFAQVRGPAVVAPRRERLPEEPACLVAAMLLFGLSQQPLAMAVGAVA